MSYGYSSYFGCTYVRKLRACPHARPPNAQAREGRSKQQQQGQSRFAQATPMPLNLHICGCSLLNWTFFFFFFFNLTLNMKPSLYIFTYIIILINNSAVFIYNNGQWRIVFAVLLRYELPLDNLLSYNNYKIRNLFL